MATHTPQIGMTRKGIVKRMDIVVQNFLDDIFYDDLRKRVKDSIIITGGSVASMLLGEKVNDYDVYFTDALVLHDYLYYKLEEIPVESRPSYNLNIAEDGQSVNIYIPNFGAWDASVAMPDAELEQYALRFVSSNAITLEGDIQVVTRFVGDLEYIHSNFDFVHATCAYIPATGQLHCPEAALASLLSRTLYYSGSKYPLCSLFRMRKFLSRGWRINAGQITKIALQISNLDLRDIDVLRDQLTGVDYTYMVAFIHALENVQPERLNEYSYLANLIDRIFGDDE